MPTPTRTPEAVAVEGPLPVDPADPWSVGWLLPGTGTVAESVQRADALIDRLHREAGDGTAGAETAAMALRAALTHRPVFVVDEDEANARGLWPVGCAGCGTSDGSGQCHVWVSAMRAVAAMEILLAQGHPAADVLAISGTTAA